REEQAVTHTDIGSTHFSLGEFEKAAEQYKAALDLWRASKNRAEETATLIKIGTVCLAWGRRTQARKRTDQAVEYYNSALKAWREAGNPEGEIATLLDIGSAYYSLRSYQKAVETYQDALNKPDLPLRDRATALTNLGSAHN